MTKDLMRKATERFKKSWTMNLQPIHWAFVCYYAKRGRKTRAEIMRELIETVADLDKSFDPTRFEEFALNEMIEREPTPRAREVLRAQVAEFVTQRRAA
jgi:hypothetical protein